MKLITRVLIVAIAFFMSISVMDAQEKGKGSIEKSKPKKTKQVNSATIAITTTEITRRHDLMSDAW